MMSARFINSADSSGQEAGCASAGEGPVLSADRKWRKTKVAVSPYDDLMGLKIKQPRQSCTRTQSFRRGGPTCPSVWCICAGYILSTMPQDPGNSVSLKTSALVSCLILIGLPKSLWATCIVSQVLTPLCTKCFSCWSKTAIACRSMFSMRILGCM